MVMLTVQHYITEGGMMVAPAESQDEIIALLLSLGIELSEKQYWVLMAVGKLFVELDGTIIRLTTELGEH